jgi:hypothetical protein
MARQDAQSLLLQDGATSAKLAEIYGSVIENVQKMALSQRLKSTTFSGDPLGGSVEYKRFVNAEVQAYGTARTAGEGNKVKAEPTTVNIDNDQEIIEEVSKKDVALYGVDGMTEKRKANHIRRMVAYLDREFFGELDSVATAHSAESGTTDIQDKMEQLIQKLEVLENDFVDGVDRELMVITLKPVFYGQMRSFMDTITRPGIDGSVESFSAYHGVRVESNYRQTANSLLFIDQESIAQPVLADMYDAEKIPLSNDIAIELFFSTGVEALTPDMVFSSDLADVA